MLGLSKRLRMQEYSGVEEPIVAAMFSFVLRVTEFLFVGVE